MIYKEKTTCKTQKMCQNYRTIYIYIFTYICVCVYKIIINI